MRIRRIRLAAFVALSLLALAPAASSAQRTFVSTSGDDAYTCSIASPCRSFAKAITVTDPVGELVVLDSGGYGFVTVNKNVTIVSPALRASVAEIELLRGEFASAREAFAGARAVARTNLAAGPR